MRQYIVDAFTDKVFHGNPAAVCVMESWPEESLMKNIARENNLSETAFVVKEGEHYRLRWFTPTCEVGLCGHGTLASGFTVLSFYEKEASEVTFHTLGGMLTVRKAGDMYEMSFPNIQLDSVQVSDSIVDALGCRPVEAFMGKDLDLICILDDEKSVRDFIPNAERLSTLPGRMVHITAPGSDGFDCCSRCFGPKIGILEDPVCGSAHCQIIPYWAKRLGKSVIDAYEASERGGSLQGEIVSDSEILIRGNAVLFGMTAIACESSGTSCVSL